MSEMTIVIAVEDGITYVPQGECVCLLASFLPGKIFPFPFSFTNYVHVRGW